MNRRFVLSCLMLAGLAFGVAARAHAQAYYPLDKIVPGQKAVGRTVFLGTKIEEFPIEIIGVLHNVGPNQNQILARVTGGPAVATGIYAGMSGSPVFIDGKIVGAIAYAFPFSKEAIAGITPIQEIVSIFDEKPAIRQTIARSDLNPARLYSTPTALSPGAQLPSVRVDGAAHAVAGPLPGLSMEPIASPLNLSGFSPQALQYFAPQFQALGLSPVRGGGGGGGPASTGSAGAGLEPGSTLTVQLVRGDMDINASGTVTWVEGDRIYAFGHPFLSMGYTDLPMNRGEVLTILPNLAVSSKVSVTREFVGSIRQDRATGILGIRGRKPALIPVHIKLHTSRNEVKDFNYEVVADNFLTPFLMNFTVFNTLVSSERSLGSQTLQVRGKIRVADQPDVEFENAVAADINTPVYASLAVASPVNFLMSSGFKNVNLKSIDIDIEAVEEVREARLEGIWQNRLKVKRGEEVELTVFLKRGNGETVTEKYPVRIPEDIAPGPLNILVSDGITLVRSDADDVDFVPKDLGQLIKAINNLKRNNRLYVRLYRSEPGAVIQGEGLPDLPPSMMTILGSSKTAGSLDSIQNVVLGEYELQQGNFVINGKKVVRVEVIN